MATISPSHTALCVGDLDRSIRFYTEGLGYERVVAYEAAAEVAGLCEIEEPPPIAMRVQFLVLDGVQLELVAWPHPGTRGTPSRSRNELGLTHLSYAVTDMASVEARLVSLGATLLETTRMHVERPTYETDMVFLADPDGTRIELVETRQRE